MANDNSAVFLGDSLHRGEEDEILNVELLQCLLALGSW